MKLQVQLPYHENIHCPFFKTKHLRLFHSISVGNGIQYPSKNSLHKENKFFREHTHE